MSQQVVKILETGRLKGEIKKASIKKTDAFYYLSENYILFMTFS